MRTGTGPEDRAARLRSRLSSPRCSAILRSAAKETPWTSSFSAARTRSCQYSGGIESRLFHEATVGNGVPPLPSIDASLATLPGGKRSRISLCEVADLGLPPPLGGRSCRREFVMRLLCIPHSRPVNGTFVPKRTVIGA